MNKLILLLIVNSVSVFSEENVNIDSLIFVSDKWPVNSDFPNKIILPENKIIELDTNKLTVILFSDATDSTLVYYSEFFNRYESNPMLEIIFIIYSKEELKLENRFFQKYKKYYYYDMNFRKKFKLGYIPQIFVIHDNNLDYGISSDEFSARIAFRNYFYGRIKCFE